MGQKAHPKAEGYLLQHFLKLMFNVVTAFTVLRDAVLCKRLIWESPALMPVWLSSKLLPCYCKSNHLSQTPCT